MRTNTTHNTHTQIPIRKKKEGCAVVKAVTHENTKRKKSQDRHQTIFQSTTTPQTQIDVKIYNVVSPLSVFAAFSLEIEVEA